MLRPRDGKLMNPHRVRTEKKYTALLEHDHLDSRSEGVTYEIVC